MQYTDEELSAILNEQTGELSWSELERHFARGVVLKVSNDLDLIDVAVSIVRDNKEAMTCWTDSKQVDHANEQDARQWHEQQARFWAVVVVPWVLIQQKD